MNPRDSMSSALERARSFSKKFHWGLEPAPKAKRARVPHAPRALTTLGRLKTVVYATEKAGDGWSEYEHDFGEDGGRVPELAVDVDTGKLHIVGGSYRVEERGIVD
jgi:hypothetical protein